MRTRFRAAPDCAWAAEVDGEVVGSVFAARWGTFGFFGPLTTRPDVWDGGVGGRLMEPVTEAFDGWDLRQAGALHLPAQRQAHRPLPAVRVLAALPDGGDGEAGDGRRERVRDASRGFPTGSGPASLEAVRGLTDAVFAGLDLEREIAACDAQQIGDTVLLYEDDRLAGVAVCHCGAGSEAGSGACYVKFGAARPGPGAADRFEALLDACETFAAASGLERIVAGVNTGRLDAYRRMLQRGFRAVQIGVSMRLTARRPRLRRARALRDRRPSLRAGWVTTTVS